LIQIYFRTLFNILLQSDLCKVRALDLVERATTSIWPGTTISLLKFPVMNPTPLRLELRRRRLLKFRSWLMKERRLSRDILKETGDSKYVTLHAYVDNTFKDMDEKTRPVAPSNLAYLSNEKMFINTEQKLRDIKKRSWTLDHEAFAKGKWCYDTPGTVNNEQVLNIFTLDELIAILPKKMMVPRTFVVKPNETLLIAGIARIDFLELTADERGPTFLSVFANDSLPVNVMKTCEVKAFFERYWGSPALVVPFGSTKRLSDFPEMKSQKISFDSNGLEIGCADVIFSSIGWVCVTAPKSKIRLEAYTPGGRGLSLRVPPILPLCASNRGPRIVGTAAYKVKRVKLPVNMTRKWKKRNLKEN
uniref:KOW domain-containing protein n=1 Tax=Dracunculus medinensis TaxID=318479 RepID=A0A0N4UJY5_DRAME